MKRQFMFFFCFWLYCMARICWVNCQEWSEPRLLESGDNSCIRSISNLFVLKNSSLHLAWLGHENTIRYISFEPGSGNLLRPAFKFRPQKPCSGIQLIFDDDNFLHLFWVEEGFEVDSTYKSKGIWLEVPVLASSPYYGDWRSDTIRARIQKQDLIYFSTSLSQDGTIYVCWEESNQWAIFLSSKPKGKSDWIIPGGPMFPEFMNDAGDAGNPHLISGTLQDLYLTFIGSRDADAVGGPAYKYTNFVYYAEKPFHKGRWNEPVLVYKDFVSAAIWPRIAVDQSGVRHILWMQVINPNQCRIRHPFYSFSSDGQHWSPARDLAGWAAWFGSHQIVIDSQGTVHVFWCQYWSTEEKSGGIYYCHGRENTWSEPQLIFADLPDKWYDLAGIAIDGNDRLHMIRKVAYGPQGGIYKRELEYLWCDLSPTAIAQSLRSHPTQVQGLLSLQSYPNPFNDTITMTLLPQKECRVSLEIYNIAGQCVRRIMDEVRIAGEYSCQWDGRNDTGLALPSGIYYLKANALEGERARPFQIVSKLLLLK